MHTAMVGPVELNEGALTLRIPLAAGGDEFIDVLHDAARVEDAHLVVVIPASLGFTAGALVEIARTGSTFVIRPAPPTADADRVGGLGSAALMPLAWRRTGSASANRFGFGVAFAPRHWAR